MPKLIKKPWSIVGAGPSGAMQALILSAIFPDQEIYVLDRYRQHVRGHGLQFLNNTTRMCTGLLNEIKIETHKILKAQNFVAHDKLYYHQVLTNIEKTEKFLKKNFTGFMTGPFIRTYVVSDLMREFAENGLQNSNVKFLMKNEVKREHLQALVDGDTTFDHLLTSDDVVTKDCLERSEFIFGADGAQSKVREVIFGETNEDLDKETMAYVIEIKLEMKDGGDPLNFLKRSALPTLVNGHLHVWSQSKSGTAALHIFVEKEQFDLLRSKRIKGKAMGEFTNPYRRLKDLPVEIVKPIQDSITNIIGIGNFEENSIKITTLPMATYTATKLVTTVNGRSFGLVGDSGVDLVLERGVNNGLYSAAEYGRALFARELEMRANKETIIVSTHNSYKNLHDDKLFLFIKNLKATFDIDKDQEEVIIKKFSKFFKIIMESNIQQKHAHSIFVNKKEFEFLAEVSSLLPKVLVKKIPLSAPDLFSNLKIKANVDNNKKNALDYCEDKIFKRAAKVIAEIKVKFGFINFLKNIYGKFVSLYFNIVEHRFNSQYFSALSYSSVKKLKSLQKSIPSYDFADQHVQYMKSAEWTFNMDRITLFLTEKIGKFAKQGKINPKIIAELNTLLAATKTYVLEITKIINENSHDVNRMSEAVTAWKDEISQSKQISRSLVAPALRSSWKLTINVDNLTTTVLDGFVNFVDNYENQGSTRKLGLFGKSADLKAKSYKWLFENPNISINTRLCIIYSLLQDSRNNDLQKQIIKLFPDKARVTLADIQDEIMKIIKMHVPIAKSRAFSQGLVEIGKCVRANTLPTAAMTNKLDYVFKEEATVVKQALLSKI